MATSGNVLTFAGGASAVCGAATSPLGDGCPATQAIFSAPTYVTLDAVGNVYVVDSGNQVIREIAAGTVTGGTVTTVAGMAGASCGGFVDGAPALAMPLAQSGCGGGGRSPQSVHRRHQPRRARGVWQRTDPVGGGGLNTPGYTGDGGAANAAQLNNVGGLRSDGTGTFILQTLATRSSVRF